MARSHKILIIDDDPASVRATKSVLERYYAVSCAHHGKEGWQKLKEDMPDLIILDVMAEKISEGWLFSTEVKRERAFHNIPIIMLSGMKRQTAILAAKDVSRGSRMPQTDLFMEKPVSRAELLINIKNMLQRRPFSSDPILHEGKVVSGGKKLVLIVEPDIAVAAEYGAIFGNEGYDTQIVASVAEAVHELRNRKCDCIVVDVDLREMAGYDAVSVIKTLEPRVNIIITAAHNSKELESRVRKEDIFYYYIKSFDRDELKLAIRDALKLCSHEVQTQ